MTQGVLEEEEVILEKSICFRQVNFTINVEWKLMY
jgi:hypothetical protein